MRVPAWLLRHEVLIEPYTGDSAYGPVYGAQQVQACLVEHKRRQVKDQQGRQEVSNTTVYLPPGTVCPPKSRVTLPSGTVSYTITTMDHSAPGLPTPDHVEVVLQ